jgi:uncharacterized protein
MFTKKEKYQGPMNNEKVAYWAIRNNDLEKLTEYIKRFGVDAPVEDGTSLHQAVFHNNIDAVKLLLENGADPNALYNNGFTPLIAAIDWKHWAIAELLIQYNADVTKKDALNNSPLDKAILYFNGDTTLIELLLSKGADPWQELTPGYTPMDLAKSMELESLLLKLIIKTKR